MSEIVCPDNRAKIEQQKIDANWHSVTSCSSARMNLNLDLFGWDHMHRVNQQYICSTFERGPEPEAIDLESDALVNMLLKDNLA